MINEYKHYNIKTTQVKVFATSEWHGNNVIWFYDTINDIVISLDYYDDSHRYFCYIYYFLDNNLDSAPQETLRFDSDIVVENILLEYKRFNLIKTGNTDLDSQIIQHTAFTTRRKFKINTILNYINKN